MANHDAIISKVVLTRGSHNRIHFDSISHTIVQVTKHTISLLTKLFHLFPMPVRSPQDVYATHISSSRGYPIWSPDPSSNRPEGLRIGDVGVVNPSNGHFDVFLNLCVPKDHDLHHSIGVPEGFSHVELSDGDIQTVVEAESAGKVFSGSSVTRVGDNGDGTLRYVFAAFCPLLDAEIHFVGQSRAVHV